LRLNLHPEVRVNIILRESDMKEIKDKIDEVQGEINRLVGEAEGAVEDVHAEIEMRIAELKAEKERLEKLLADYLDKAKAYADDLVGDSKGFFAKYKYVVLAVAGLLVVGVIGLLLI
jgi:phage host-nuclease inhibitor protein Gam